MKLFLRWFYRRITARHPVAVLAVTVLLSLVSLWIASDLKYNSRLDNLLPQEMDLVQEFNQVVGKTGGSGPLVLVLEGLSQKDAPHVTKELAERLQGLPGARYVDYRLPIKFLKHRQLLLASKKDLEEIESMVEGAVEYARSQLSGFFGGTAEPYNPAKLQSLAEEYKIFEEINPYYKGKSHKYYFIFVQPRGTVTNTGFTADFVGSVRDQIRESQLEEQFPGLKISLTGSMMTRLEENEVIVEDLTNAALLAVVLATSILVLYTRSFLSLVLIFFPLAVSLSYTFAITRLFIGHVNIISGFLVAILMGLGIDYGIHLYIRFKQELLKGIPIPEAVELVVTQVGRSGIIAMMTTLSVFSLLIGSDFRGFSEFGTIAAVGIICAFISYYLLFPAQILIANNIHWMRKPRPRMFSFKISRLYANTPRFLSILFILVLVASLFLIPKIEFERDFQKLRGESPAADFESETTDDFGFAFSPTVIMTDSKEHLFEIHKVLETIQRKYGDDSTIGLHHSLNAFTQKEFNHKKEVLQRISQILEDESDIIEMSLGTSRYQKLKLLAKATPFDESQIPDTLIKRFSIEDQFLILILSPADKNFFEVENIYQLQKEISDLKSELAQANIPYAVLNENLMAAAIFDWVREKGPMALVWAMGVVFIILVIDFGSLRFALKTFIPLMTGLALTGGLMAAFNFKLNFINIVMLPSIVGIMIDHCIYLAHHILDYSEGETVKSLQETGSSILLSALTTLAGYASLNIAHHAGVRSIAGMMELGIITCTFCALFMLPALFQLGAHKFRSLSTR